MIVYGLKWEHKVDAKGFPPTHPSVTILAALRQLAFGVPGQAGIEEFGIASPTADFYLEKFCDSMINKFGDKFGGKSRQSTFRACNQIKFTPSQKNFICPESNHTLLRRFPRKSHQFYCLFLQLSAMVSNYFLYIML